MRAHATTARRSAQGEEAEAAIRALFGLTGSVGVLLTLIALSTGATPFVAIPTVALLVCLLLRAPIGWSASAAVGIWGVMVPSTPGEALIAPLSMIVACLALALGPERLLGWLARDATASPRADVAQDGWIEDEPRRIG